MFQMDALQWTADLKTAKEKARKVSQDIEDCLAKHLEDLDKILNPLQVIQSIKGVVTPVPPSQIDVVKPIMKPIILASANKTSALPIMMATTSYRLRKLEMWGEQLSFDRVNF